MIPKKKKLVKVPGIKPDLYLEVDSDITDEDLQVKINRILEQKRAEEASLKTPHYAKALGRNHPWHCKEYTGPIYSLTDIQYNH